METSIFTSELKDGTLLLAARTIPWRRRYARSSRIGPGSVRQSSLIQKSCRLSVTNYILRSSEYLESRREYAITGKRFSR